MGNAFRERGLINVTVILIHIGDNPRVGPEFGDDDVEVGIDGSERFEGSLG